MEARILCMRAVWLYWRGIERNDSRGADCPVLWWCGIICTTTATLRHMSICQLFANSIQELLEEHKKYNRVNSLE